MNDQLQSTQDLNNVQEEITRIVGENNIVLFMKGNAHFPQCGFSGRAVEILRSLQAEFVTIDVLSNEAVRAGIKDYSNWPTIPQLYIQGEFIGGSDIMTEMFESGELAKLLQGA